MNNQFANAVMWLSLILWLSGFFVFLFIALRWTFKMASWVGVGIGLVSASLLVFTLATWIEETDRVMYEN